MQRFALLLSLSLLPAACNSQPTAPAEVSSARLEAAQVGSLARLNVLGDFWFASQPTPDDLARLAERGVRTVLNLRSPSEDLGFDERAVVEKLGLRYVQLPIAGPDDLTDATFDRARQVLSVAERPILVHCKSANRVGAIFLPWRVLDGHRPLSEALAEAHQIGLRSPALEAKAKAYIERHAD